MPISYGLALVTGLLIVTVISLESKCSGEYCSLQDNLFKWINENGGYVNSNKLVITTGPDEAWAVRGIFASQPLGKGELLLTLPPALRICSPVVAEGQADDTRVCHLIETLAVEMKKGSDSFYWPYLDILETDFIDIPQTWEAERLQWLDGIYTTADWKINSVFMEQGCHFDASDAMLARAGLLVFSRATGVQLDGQEILCMCPVYDLLNHDHAGLNTAGAVQGQVFSIGTTASVDKGGQLFNLFGPNNVANIFRDYGFLPSYPRVWELAVPYPAGDKRDKHDRDMGSRSEAVLFVFEEMEDKRIDLYPLQSTRLKVDRSTMATAFKNHLTEVQRQSSVLNAALLANKTTVSTHIHKAKWFRVQYTLAFARALHAAESTTYNQQNDNNNNDRQKTPIKKQKVKKRRKLPKDDL